jgi:nucleoside-diphosphate-sugar epimerase
MPRVLITGGTGFVGSFTAEAYLAAGWNVRALIRDPLRRKWLEKLPVEFAVGKLDDPHSLREACGGCDVVVHCAALTKTFRREDYFRINADAVGEFAKVAKQTGVKRFVLCSTQAVAGPSAIGKPSLESDPPHPLTSYGESKLAGERKLVENAQGMEWIILRPSAVMGPRDEQFVPLFRGLVRYGLYPQFGGGQQLYSFISVHDLARALLIAGQNAVGMNEIYFVAHPQPLCWEDAALTLGCLLERRVRKLMFPRWLLPVVAIGTHAVAALTRKPALLSRDKLREILAPAWICSTEKISRSWNFQCEWDHEAMLRDTLNAYRAAGWL